MTPLLVASTPIGNPGDASTRLREAIESAEIIAAEDSRKLARLASDLGIRYSGDVLSFFDANESSRTEQLLKEIEAGKVVLLISDAGSPTVSDPGFRLIKESIQRRLPVEVLPGPSAVITALIYSGMPTDSFTFDGFIPRTDLARRAYFSKLLEERRSCIAFESPKRLVESLEVATEILPHPREVAICRELTKEYQEIFRGSIDQALKWASEREAGEGIKGEITLVFAPASDISQVSDSEILEVVDQMLENGLSVRDAVMESSKKLSLPKRYVYDLVIKREE
jgi:16S rRNA (cytidine1402-2'-O)-methyltransferase